MHAII